MLLKIMQINGFISSIVQEISNGFYLIEDNASNELTKLLYNYLELLKLVVVEVNSLFFVAQLDKSAKNLDWVHHHSFQQ